MVSRWWLPILALAFLALGSVQADLVLSEFLARNTTTTSDSRGAYSDWIELHNTGTDPVDVGGWYLTDSATNLVKWRLPSQVLPGDGYLQVFASGKNTALVGSPFHTNFKLASAGGYLALVRPDGRTVATEFINYPLQDVDVSYGPGIDLSGAGVFFSAPTPKLPNAPGWLVRAGDVSFSAAGGLFTNAFSLVLSTTQPGGEIGYTLDGTLPGESSLRYSAPLTIDRTLRVRARVLASGHVPGPVEGASYTLVGPTARTRSSNLPIIILDTHAAGISADARTRGAITVLQPANGRTTFPGSVNIHSRATFEVRGSSSTQFPKQSYGLEIRNQDESDRAISILGLPAESDWVLYAPYTDKTLIRDVLAYELSNQLGRYAPRTRLVELYVNRTGALDATDYQGIYVLIEKVKGGPDRVDIAELESTDYTVPDITGGFILKKDRTDNNDSPFTTSRGQQLGIEWPRARELGTAQLNAIRSSMNQFETALYGSQFRNGQSGYQAHIDTDSFIDHWWLVEVAKNIDGYRLSTFMYKDRGKKLNLGPIWDYNLSFGNADYNDGWKTNGWYWPLAGGSDYPWFPRLFQDPDFTQRHADRWGSLRTGVMATSNVLKIIEGLTNQLAEAQVRNFTRWPSFGRDIWPNWYVGNSYEDEIGFLKRWVIGRLAWIDTTIVKWPELTPASGYYPAGVTATLKSSYPVFYTLDGTDPRASGGTLATGALSYSGPLNLTQSARLVARARNGTKWSPPVSASLAVTIPPLRISEVMYHPAADPSGVLDDEEFEFLEVRNLGETTLDLSGVTVSQGIDFTFPTNASGLLPRENMVVVRNREAFVSRYGDGVRIAGEYSGKLDNAGERLVLTGAWGEPMDDFTYDDAWEPATDGPGYSLSRAFPIGGWQTSVVPGGTPGRDDVSPVDLHTLKVERTGPPESAELSITFPAAAGQSYSLQSAPSLNAGWTTLNHIPPQPANGPVRIVLPDEATSTRVYRIITPRAE